MRPNFHLGRSGQPGGRSLPGGEPVSMDSGGGGRAGRRGPVVVDRFKRRQLARAKIGYDEQAYDGHQDREQET